MASVTPLPPRSDADFDEGWAYLKDGLDALMVAPEPRVSQSYILALMSACYNCITSGNGMLRLDPSISMGAKLHYNVTEYFAARAVALREAADGLEGEPLLLCYAETWKRYEWGAKAADRALAHLNRKWVMYQRQEGHTEIIPVYQLALMQWKTHLLLHSQILPEKLCAALVELFNSEHSFTEAIGEAVEALVCSFVSLGIDERDLDIPKDGLYTEHLETPLVTAAESAFRTSAAALVTSISVPDYMRQAGERFSQLRRVGQCLPSKTLRVLVERWTHAFVQGNASHLWEHFRTLIFLDKREDLRHLYGLFAGVPGALEPMLPRFAEDVTRAGHAAISKLVCDNLCAIQPSPEAYTEIVLAAHRKYSPIVRRCFDGDAGFAASLQRGCRGFLSPDVMAGLSTGKAPELLVKRVDALLRKRRKKVEGEDFERALDDVATLFSYVDDKDVFQRLYAIRLAKRLIYDDSESEEAEAGILARLQDVCGAEYTRKLQRMLADSSLSKDLNARFKEHTQAHGSTPELAFTVTVFSAHVWPLPAPTEIFTLPTELLTAHTAITAYYRKAHAGRKLHWLWAHSRNELRAALGGRTYTFVASTHQAAVLLQYNACDARAFAELREATGLAEEPLRCALAPLVKAAVLVEEGEQYRLNLDFKSAKTRVNLHAALKSTPNTEDTDARAAAATARAHALRAAIVRVMKARRTLSSTDLVHALRADCAGRFSLEAAEVHEAIRKLEEQEYVTRGEGDTWVYVA
ncbi:cullin [Phanerochaete sordida]|uniref:Cullin n=1 Tax=Phanerochaete sordida TaxID=48140 RepID=A0A9P3GKB2_9APHY|nr:cullin [Phanerochaete sordida]